MIGEPRQMPPTPSGGPTQEPSRYPIYRPPTLPTEDEAKELEQAVLSGSNTVPDPRTPEAIEAERKRKQTPTLESRPACAGHYANFLTQRKAVIEAYKKVVYKEDSLTNRPPIDHQANEAEYDRAIVSAKDADLAADCSKCLQVNCALRHGIPPKKAYDLIHKKVSLRNGTEIRPYDTQLFILKGGSRNSVPNETEVVLESRQERTVNKHAGKYLPSTLL